MPDLCELCGAKVGHDRADDDIVLPFIRNHGFTKSVDDVYRQMEAGSITRTEIAAAMTGASVAEMSSLKITNLKDNQRPGDIPAVVPNNPVSELMASAPQFGFQPAAGLQFSQSTSQGPEPNAGAKMRTMLQNQHAASGHAISDRPANETLQPGYRRRG